MENQIISGPNCLPDGFTCTITPIIVKLVAIWACARETTHGIVTFV